MTTNLKVPVPTSVHQRHMHFDKTQFLLPFVAPEWLFRLVGIMSILSRLMLKTVSTPTF